MRKGKRNWLWSKTDKSGKKGLEKENTREELDSNRLELRHFMLNKIENEGIFSFSWFLELVDYQLL